MGTLRPVVEAENRLERFNQDQDRIVGEVQRRIVRRYVAAARAGEESSLEYVLNDVAYCELRRLGNPSGRAAHRNVQRWRDLAHQLRTMSEKEKTDRLDSLAEHYTRDVVGNFNPKVYRFSNEILPRALSFVFSPVKSVREGLEALGDLGDRIQIEGPIDTIRSLCDRGTLIVTPTHSSNMDSIAIGFGLGRVGLPPVTYGAGKNLFSNPLISYFMHNLGAYRVDRRLRFRLYKDVLKEYSTVLLENGYHSLFFPGGTRSRSNQVEDKLKLGLLGTVLTAYRNSLQRDTRYHRFYVVPVTINYRLVLEGETLIDDYLADTGKSRYIIDDDEFSRVGRVVEFMRKMLAHEGGLVLRFGTPLDPFGNLTDELGESLDGRGRRVEPADYLRGRDGVVCEDAQRDAEYTRALGRRLSGSFMRNTVFLSTQLFARAVFDAIAFEIGTRDIYRLIRLHPDQLTVDVDDAIDRIERLRGRLHDHPEWGVVHHRIIDVQPKEILQEALKALGTYHSRPVAVRSGDRIRVNYVKLLYYYQNRTAHIPALGMGGAR